MKANGKKRVLAAVLASAVLFSHFQAVGASSMSKAKDKKKEAEAELNETKQKIEDIERQQSALQSEIDAKDKELVNLLVNMGILEDELENKNVQLEQVTKDLSKAEKTAKNQYSSMKQRIQFMYEKGDVALLEALLGSADMSDFLSRVEYVSDVYEYDRDLLGQYQNTVKQVAELKGTVETEKAELEAMQEEYALQQSALENVLAQKRSQMGNYDNQLATAQAAADAYKKTIAAQNQIIQDEERKQKEAAEAAKRAREEARRANEGNEKGSAGGSSGGGTGSASEAGVNGSAGGSSGGTGTSGGSGSSDSAGGSSGGANPGYSTNVSGSAVVSYACQFVGNPYVWGGTSLTNGADCSGFVMSVFAHFGISLPHSSAALQGCGKEVSYANAQPGDLICYSGHVAIYMGGGSIVHAQSTAVGITTSSATYRTIVAVRRVL